MIKRRNEMKDVENIATYDFSTLYTNIPHQKLKERMKQVVEEAYEGSGKKYLSVYKSKAAWVNNPKEETAVYKKEELIDMVYYLIDNVYVTCGDSLFRQKIGIPMGTDCAPFLANLFLFSYENEWMMKMKKENLQLARKFNHSSRYIDDLLTINNDGLMKEYMNDIYPKELDLKHENEGNEKQASYLDLNINVTNQELITSIYDKRDDFPFKIVNFPDLSGNIPENGSYGVFIAQALRYTRACTHYQDFIQRSNRLIHQLVQQNFSQIKIVKKMKKWVQTSSKADVLHKYGHHARNIWHDLNMHTQQPEN
jgi:hypothetical protein